MTTIFKAAMLAALSLAGSATAALAQTSARPSGHYEWQAVRQYGPHTQVQAPERVWATAMAMQANCDCSMMQDKAASDRKTPTKAG